MSTFDQLLGKLSELVGGERAPENAMAAARGFADPVGTIARTVGNAMVRGAGKEVSGATPKARASMFPVAAWDDGLGLAVPQEVFEHFDTGRQFNNAAEAARGIPHTPEESFPRPQDARVAGLAMTGAGAFGLGTRAARATDSVAGAERAEASSGLPSHSVEAGGAPVTARAYRGTGYPKNEVDPHREYFASDSPDIAATYAQGPTPAVFPSDVTFRNPLTVDVGGGLYDQVPGYGTMHNTVQAARTAGNDGVVFRNIRDPMKGEDAPLGTTYAAIGPDTVKSATTGETLFSNAPDAAVPGVLAMDAASRMERARAQGFDPQTTWYHGTNHDVPEFDLSRFGANTQTGDNIPAVFMSSQPKAASGYAQGWGADVRDGANVMPLHARTSNVDEWDMGGGRLTEDVLQRALAEAKAEGRNGVVFRRAIDSARPIAPGGEASRNAGDVLAMFDPKNIRSKFAAFEDPDSANLLAVNPRDAAPAGLLATDAERHSRKQARNPSGQFVTPDSFDGRMHAFQKVLVDLDGDGTPDAVVDAPTNAMRAFQKAGQ
jgi:hypothetical protein